MKFVIAILIFSLIVIFHEFGHFIVAKKCHIRVNEFMLGLGPKLFGIQRGETLYSLHLLPFGGACVMEGEEEDSSDERSFNKKPVWQRMLVVVAGPIFNFILAYVLAVILISCIGYQAPTISAVESGYAADKAGIEAGDTIVSINHYHVHFFNEVSIYLFLHAKEKMDITYLHNGKMITRVITPVYDKTLKMYRIGVTGPKGYTHGNIVTNVRYGVYEMKYQIYVVFESLRMLFTGKLSANDLSGPVGIVKTIGDTYDQSISSGVFYVVMNMISMTILLSANLGVMNLLPLPALDGGRFLLYIIEAVRRKRLDPEIEGKINLIGFSVLMFLMILVMFNDIRKLIP